MTGFELGPSGVSKSCSTNKLLYKHYPLLKCSVNQSPDVRATLNVINNWVKQMNKPRDSLLKKCFANIYLHLVTTRVCVCGAKCSAS